MPRGSFYAAMLGSRRTVEDVAMVPGAGLEPARSCLRGILSPLRLPIPPPGLGSRRVDFGGWGRNRTGVHGFAGRCMTTLPPSLRIFSLPSAAYHRAAFTNRQIIKPRCEIGALLVIGAGNETRTRDPDLGKVVLYQLSYSRLSSAILAALAPLSRKALSTASSGAAPAMRRANRDTSTTRSRRLPHTAR